MGTKKTGKKAAAKKASAKKATTKKAGKAQYWRSEQWSYSEVQLMYAENPEFAEVARKALRTVRADNYAGQGDMAFELEREKKAGKDSALELAIAMIGVSNQVGQIVKRNGKNQYPHPALVLTWLIEAGTTEKLRPYTNQMQKLGGDTGVNLFADLMMAYRMPSALQGYWAQFWQKMRNHLDVGGAVPHLFTASVEPLETVDSGVVRGFRLKSLVLRVPRGNKLQSVTVNGRANTYYGPAKIQRVTVDFTTPELREKFGDVVIGISKRSIFLASSKKGRIAPVELIKLATVEKVSDADFSALPFSSIGDSLGQKIAQPIPEFEAAARVAEKVNREDVVNVDKALSAIPDYPMGYGPGERIAGGTAESKTKIQFQTPDKDEVGLAERLKQLATDVAKMRSGTA